VALSLMAAAASSQTLSDSDRAALEQKKSDLFAQMLRDPSNLDITFGYADTAAKLGDNEAAVSALERMLLFNSSLPRVDLELGALYFRMGSFDVARSYFDKAAAANPPAEVLARIAEYEAQIGNQQSTSQFSGSFFVGAQYQSDANVAPGSPLIHSPVGDVLLSQQFVKQRDVNLFASGSVLYSYDLGNQDRDAVEITASGFANSYFHFVHLNLDLGEVTAGPRLHFPDPPLPWVQSATLRPYVILNEVGLGENQYFHTYGTGLEATAVLPADLQLRSAFEFRQKYFTNAPDRPLSKGLNGNDKLVSLSLSKLITENSTLNLQLDYLDQDTSFGFYSNKTYAAALSYRIRYADPTGLLSIPLETTVFGSRSYAYYNLPDPCCNTSGTTAAASFSDRFDRHWRFGVTQTFQITPTFAVVAQLQRDIVSSNLSIYAYTTNSALIGAQIKF